MSDITKKFVNKVDTCVDDHLRGFVELYPALQLHPERRTVILPRKKSAKVGVISGGGAGHEPFVAGFIGQGMLSGGVSGSVFASPPPGNIFHCIRAVAELHEGGVLVVIPNYTGDCLNFGLGIDRANSIGLKVEGIIVDDDCSLLPEDDNVGEVRSIAGGRGIGGILFVIKIAGAMAEMGASLEDIHAEARAVLKNTATMGSCVKACSLPGQGPLFDLKGDELEVGVGIHGEAGVRREKYVNAHGTVETILNKLVNTLKPKRGHFLSVLLNNLGGASKLEEDLVLGETIMQLRCSGFQVIRAYSGLLMTSLDMSGMQISILNMGNDPCRWTKYLDAITLAPCWPGCTYSIGGLEFNVVNIIEEPRTVRKLTGLLLAERGAKLLRESILAGTVEVAENESKLNQLDSGVGDGDCGSTMKQISEGLLENVDTINWNHPGSVMRSLADIAENRLGGTSGAIYSLFFTNMAPVLESEEASNYGALWADACQAGVEGILRYSGAKCGDRTMLDALIPACEALRKNARTNLPEAIKAAVAAAKEGCEMTVKMVARAGRASYVSKELATDVDAGSYAVSLWVGAVGRVVLQNL